jgi:hypothetical protein
MNDTGYGLEGDLQMLVKSVTVLKDSLKKISNAVDLCDLYNWVSGILSHFPDFFLSCGFSFSLRLE